MTDQDTRWTYNFADNPCAARSGSGNFPGPGVAVRGEGWWCSLETGHQGQHEAYDLGDVKPRNLIASWS